MAGLNNCFHAMSLQITRDHTDGAFIPIDHLALEASVNLVKGLLPAPHPQACMDIETDNYPIVIFRWSDKFF